MRRPSILGLGVVLVLAVPSMLYAQRGRRCDLVQAADSRQLMNAAGQEVLYFQDPVRMNCTGQVRLEADSAVWNRGTGSLELVGHVVYRDSATELTADWTNYFGREDRLASRGNVVLTDLLRGSRVTGEQLDYQRATASRPESRMVVYGQRAYALIRQDPRGSGIGAGPAAGAARTLPGAPVGAPVDDTSAADAAFAEPADTAGPLEVWGERLEFIGETVFNAQNDVDLKRGAMTGGGDFARYDQTAEELELLGGAHVEDDRYRLEGNRIHATLEGEVLREVTSEASARLTSAELVVISEQIRIAFVEGQIDRMEAWSPASAGAQRRARAIAEGFDLRADSIDARADSGRISEVRAVGRAYGERNADSLASSLPPVIAHDWIQGDTIIGYFAADTAAAAAPDSLAAPVTDSLLLATDSAAGAGIDPLSAPRADSADSTAVALERVVVIGGSSPALSLYRMEPENEGVQKSINFMRAKQIILVMSNGEVTRVEALGPIDGMYLDPVTGQPVPDGGDVPPPPERETGR
jgi:lipopolysaccharide export system protein LptA